MPAGSSTIDTQALREQLSELRNQYDELVQEREAIKGQQGDVPLQQATSDRGYARSEENRLRVATNARKNALEKSHQDERGFKNQIKKFGDDLGVIYQRCVSSQDLTDFLWRKFDRDLAQAAFMGALQAYCELRNAGGEILRSFHAACMKMSAAIMGTGSSASVQFAPPRYLQIPDGMPQAPVERAAETNSKWRDYHEQLHKFNKLKEDRFTDNEIKRAEDEFSASEIEHADAEAAKKVAESREEGMRAAFKDHRARFATVQEQMQNLERQMRNIKLQMEEERRQQGLHS